MNQSCLWSSRVIASMAVFAAISPPTLASTGKEGGNGGDARCAEYSDMIGRIASALLTIGQAKVDQANVIVRVDDLWKIKRSLKCLPVKALDRQARSYSSESRTELLAESWAGLSLVQKIRLSAHELAVLANYEADGEYFISESMIEILAKNSQFFKNATRAEQVVENPDGSISFVRPFFLDSGGTMVPFGAECKSWNFVQDQGGDGDWLLQPTSSLAEGICKFFGYSSVVTYGADPGTLPLSALFFRYSSVDSGGHFHGVFSNSNYLQIVNSVTCK